MAEWISNLFSSSPGLDRVNPSGLIVMGVGLAVAIAGGVFFRGEAGQKKSLAARLVALIIAAAGALIAIYGKTA